MPDLRLAGTVKDDGGTALNNLTVNIYDVNTTTPVRATTTTNSSGDWAITHTTRGRFDVEIQNGSDRWWWHADDEVQLKTVQIQNPDADEHALIVTRNEDAASVEVALFEGDRATVADGDTAYISFVLSDSAGNQDEQARISWAATTVLSGATQDGDLFFSALVNETLTEMIRLDGSASEIDIAVDMDFVASAARWSSGVAVVGTEYSVQRDADGTNQLHLNVPTGATFEFSVNDAAQAVLGASSLTGNVVGTGASQVAAGNHTHASSAGVTREGGNTTEGTTTSVTTADILTAASLSITAATPFFYIHGARKTGGAAAAAETGLKLNTTNVGDPTLSARVGPVFSTTDRAEDGIGQAFIGARVTNYLDPGVGIEATYVAAGGTLIESNVTRPTRTANVPTATITDLVINAISGSASVTVGADELHVYEMVTS